MFVKNIDDKAKTRHSYSAKLLAALQIFINTKRYSEKNFSLFAKFNYLFINKFQVLNVCFICSFYARSIQFSYVT